MRISIALSLLILAIGATLGFQDHQRLTVVRSNHDKLVAEAAQSGIVIDPAHPETGVRLTKRDRHDKQAVAHQFAAEFIAFAKEMEAMEKSGKGRDDGMQKKILEVIDRMMSLDASQLKILIAEVRAAKDLKDETRQGLIGFSIMTLANDHPQAALTLFTESSDLFKESGMGNHVISSALSKWAKEDPMAALDWVRKNGEKFPDLVNDDAKRGMISGAAVNDPKLAFSLIDELGMKDPTNSTRSIIDAARTPAERTATLAALRDYQSHLTDPEKIERISQNAISQFLQNAAKDGFEAGTKWITEAGFTPAELQTIGSGGFSYHIENEDIGKWAQWMGETLPAEKFSETIRTMVTHWTENDYQAAGTWLAAAPDGPTKETSVRAYAETVSKYDPETAAQWALTLPPGKNREQTIRSIYENWPKDDASTKEAFANKHGIK